MYKNNGALPKMLFHLHRAYSEGKLQESDVFFQATSDRAQNALRHKNGHRFSPVNAKLAAIMSLKYGFGAAHTMSSLTGMSQSTQKRRTKDLTINMEPGLCRENFKKIRQIYEAEISQKMGESSTKPPIMCTVCTDETPVQQNIAVAQYIWNKETWQWEYILGGFCGFKVGKDPNGIDSSHCCFAADERVRKLLCVNSLDDILNCFEVLQVATSISADILVPLGNLSDICLSVVPTCMRFTKEDDSNNSRVIEELVNNELSDIFGYPLTGNGSDGALTRETKGMENMTLKNPDGTSQPTINRYMPLGPDCKILGMAGHI